jgi:parallel beta-helix repeat protein
VKENSGPMFFVFPAAFVILLLSGCDLFQVSLADYLQEDSLEEQDEGSYVYVKAASGDDAKPGRSAGEAVKTIGRALAIWAAEGSAEARIMLLEDVPQSHTEGNPSNGMIDFSALISGGVNSVTLAGAGGGKTIDNGSVPGRRVLYINNPGKTITLKNLTVTGGNSGAGGGGIGLQAGALVIDGGVVVAGNRANAGGGVYINRGTVTMEGGIIRDNTADEAGGGVYITGSGAGFVLRNGTISGNRASSPAAGKGGGVCAAEEGTFTMEGGTISGNVSGNDGGGVYVYGSGGLYGTALIREGVIGVQGGGNRAKYGGGVYVGKNGRLALGSAGGNGGPPYIQYNTAGEGGAGTGGGVVVHDDSGTQAEAVFHHGTIRENYGDTLGGGVLIVQGTLTMNGGSIRGNRVAPSGRGPGIMVQSHQYPNEFKMGGLARVLDDGNPVFLDYDPAHPSYGTRQITLNAFTGDLSGGIAKIALASSGYTPGATQVLTGTDIALHHNKCTIISPPGHTINGAGILQ